MNDPIRILIADDHIIVRSGVRLLLEAEAGIEVVGEALDGIETLKQVEATKPDVVLMDITMPGMDGLEATRQITDHWPAVKVLALTMHRSDEYFFEMLKAGACGYILKGAEANELINAVKVVARGEVFLYPTMASKLVQNYLSRETQDAEPGINISKREIEIMQLLAEGYSNKEIAERLVISPSTVHSHRSNLMTKLGLSNRREIIQYARTQGLMSK